ncbi:hypothetical protein ACLVWU_11890 [Bdellovibrio sp. HCB290]|uniref:hypothetical protein n=1 Tax=Bdellovibrio sp. HCB290 TaxID=3394356 RepID=UPI0039B659CD
MKKPVLLIAISALMLSFTTACQEGVKKTEDTQVHSDGVASLDQIAVELNSYDMDLNAPLKPLPENEPITPIPHLEKAQVLLEKYILKADKLIELGDTRVVLFPEKERIINSRKKAYRFLGDVYARQSINNTTLAVENRDVANIEMEMRVRIFINMIRTFTGNGITQDVLINKTWDKVIKTMSTDVLATCVASTQDSINNGTRINELGDRYDGFGIPGFKAAFHDFPAIAYMFVEIAKQMKAELELRAQTK